MVVAPLRDRLVIMQRLVTTSLGDARITSFPADGPHRATLLLGHGAGGGTEAPDLQALAADLPAEGVQVELIEQPWRVAGKRLAPAPKTLDLGWLEILRQRSILEQAGGEPAGHGAVPLIVGGRSAGARVACRTGRETGAAGVLALAFPLHPPGKPDKSRAEELLSTGLPTLVVQGAVDPFGRPDEFPPLPATHRLAGLPAGGHEFSVRKTQEPVLGELTRAVAEWIRTLFLR